MIGYFRTLATDFDGTLTHDGRRPDERVLAALRQARDQGCLVVLVTGRILSELRSVFPDFEDHFDAIVAENGCVFWHRNQYRRLADPVNRQLALELARRGVKVRVGDVLLAGQASDRVAVLEEAHRLELDCQLVFNRSELMILPSGVNKGTGLYEALGDLGVSRHSAVAVGDAENDLALLDVCEVGIAVADAVGSLRAFADIVMTKPNGDGVTELLSALFHGEAPAVHSRRWQVRLGSTSDGQTATVPSSQINILICGDPSTGKSNMVGLFAERLIGQGYCVLVIDPEGGNRNLGQLRGVVVIDGQGGLPHPDRVAELFSHRYTSVVLDLSQVDEETRNPYLHELASVIERSRAACGLPHWIIGDEAHRTSDVFSESSEVAGTASEQRWGFCLATYRPDLIKKEVAAQLDAVITMGSGQRPSAELLDLLVETSQLDRSNIVEAVSRTQVGSAYLAIRPALGTSTRFQVGTRVTEYRRRWHKYTDLDLPPERSFYFRDQGDSIVAVASNLRTLAQILPNCSPNVIEHHARGHDLSQWIQQVFQDQVMAENFATIEDQVCAKVLAGSDAGLKMTRHVHRRYGV